MDGIVVFGSINMDLVVRAPHAPESGETVIGSSFATVPGGKGANQAVAAARLGRHTRLVGRVGADVFGDALCRALVAAGVDTGGVETHATAPSGVALITIDDAAENRIVVAPGANAMLDHDDLDRLETALAGARILLLQLEVPLAVVGDAAQRARSRGVLVLLDPAPAVPLSPDLYRAVDVLTPNQTEAAQLVGHTGGQPLDVPAAAETLLGRGVGAVIIKLGDRGVYLATAERRQYRPAFIVTAVDTVAAGDAFNGALAVALDEGASLDVAVEWGLAAGAIAVTRPGAQSALPNRTEVLDLLAHGTRRSLEPLK
jgi:ribokinase